MNDSPIIIQASLPEIQKAVRLIAATVISSVLFVCGTVMSIVEASFIYEEIAAMMFTPLLICSLSLTALGACSLTYLLVIKKWGVQSKQSYRQASQRKRVSSASAIPYPPQRTPHFHEETNSNTHH